MKLFVLILNKTEKLDELMTEFAHKKICGATILDSTGMARELYGSAHDEEEISFLGSIRGFLSGGGRSGSKTILTVLKDGQEQTILDIVEEVVGDLMQPDTGIMFILPIEYAKGKGIDN